MTRRAVTFVIACVVFAAVATTVTGNPTDATNEEEHGLRSNLGNKSNLTF